MTSFAWLFCSAASLIFLMFSASSLTSFFFIFLDLSFLLLVWFCYSFASSASMSSCESSDWYASSKFLPPAKIASSALSCTSLASLAFCFSSPIYSLLNLFFSSLLGWTAFFIRSCLPLNSDPIFCSNANLISYFELNWIYAIPFPTWLFLSLTTLTFRMPSYFPISTPSFSASSLLATS